MAYVKEHIIQANKLELAILNGEYGKSGAKFLTTSALSKALGVSLVTAHLVLKTLHAKRLLLLVGHKYYLSYKRFSKDSELRKLYSSANNIGLVVPSFNPYFAELAEKTQYWASQYGLNLITCTSGKSINNEKTILDNFFRLKVAGVISCPVNAPDMKQVYDRYPLPFVFLSHKLEDTDYDLVLADNYGAAYNVARHFHENGYVNYIYISKENVGLDLRQKGFIDGLNACGHNLPEKNIFYMDKDSISIEPKINHALHGSVKPLAVFCYHDLFAVKVIEWCRKAGYKTPQEVGIVGFDNLDIAQSISPQLTSVDYRTDKMAQAAVLRLKELIKNYDAAPKETDIDTVLIIRESSARNKNASPPASN